MPARLIFASRQVGGIPRTPGAKSGRAQVAAPQSQAPGPPIRIAVGARQHPPGIPGGRPAEVAGGAGPGRAHHYGSSLSQQPTGALTHVPDLAALEERVRGLTKEVSATSDILSKAVEERWLADPQRAIEMLAGL